MHHKAYGSVTGDTLCPLGFHPQVRWPTRCKRCFRDYKDHVGKRGSLKDTTASSPSLSGKAWEASPTRRSSESPESRRTWASTSNLTKDEKSPQKSTTSLTWSSALDISQDPQESSVASDANPPPGQRSRNYAGSQSDSFNYRRHSIDETMLERPPKLQIKNVIDNSNGTNSDHDVEFIIQVRKSRSNDVASKNNGPGDEAPPEMSEKGGKTEKNEIEKLRAQLSDMKARCERVEREKSDILLRRLATIDTVSSKSSSNELTKLQKTVKELQAKNETLSEEKTSLMTKIRNLERDTNSRLGRNEREKASEELRSKLKAAETLCESLMDENEDMKKEIRDLEEEIYEMQDNFREEQADEYTSLRKSLEQSNKNCRILSFKLRKIERKAEQLETEKGDIEKKYDEVKRIEEVLKKFGDEYKNRSQKKSNSDYSTRVQLKKMVEDMEKEIGDVFGIFASIIEGKGFDATAVKGPENNAKYEKLLKEHETVKLKLENTMKELAIEKEKKKAEAKLVVDNKNADAQSLKKKLEDSMATRELEKKSWDSERVKLQEEKEKLKLKLLSLSAEKLKTHNEVTQLKKDLEMATSTETNTAKMEVMVEQTKVLLEGELKRAKQDLETSKSSTSFKLAKITAELAEVKKERDTIKAQAEEEKLSKDTEIGSLKKKMASLEKAGLNAKKMNELKQSYTDRISHLEDEVKRNLERYDELNGKHGKMLESRERLENENQTLTSKLSEQKERFVRLESELKTLQETHNSQMSAWTKEKSRLEDKLRELEKSQSNFQLTEAKEEINRLVKENNSLTDQLSDLRKMNEDLTSKLKDYNSVSKVQRNFTADTDALEAELRRTKNALANAEKSKKADMAQCKLRYEHRIKAINDEIQSIQNQLSRYKRERDTYKHMLEGAQKTIADLKVVRQRRQSTTSTGKSDEDDENSSTTNVSVLERQISCMEDELSESRLEASKLKTELVSEKSGWQIKLAEMQSRINELEEERLLASGRTKIPGLKVRMELAWQKEREEQQRLLQETATLARDLRQTLFEVERERDKERLENKRRQDQLKKVFDEEKDENKKKLVELQCDLLELRDAHAKLRTSNEKMRREKERHEREREELRDVISNKRRLEQAEARNINVLLQQVDDLMRLFPELSTNRTDGKMPDTYTPTPPRRTKGPKSRESSPMLEGKDEIRGSTTNLAGRTEKLEYTIGKLMEVAKELQDSKKAIDDSNSSRSKKFGKRSTSIDNDSGRGSTPSRGKPSLKRKSLSLEQTAGKNDQLIWGTDSNVSSMQSLDSEVDSRHFSMQRDSSVDSRLSGGSTKSEMLQRDKKYNKNIIRKITTKLTKSASVDDPNASFDYSMQTSGSEASITADEAKHEKRNLKKKLTDMFKRSSRSNGLDKKMDDASRPSSRASSRSKQ
ncbi:plectin isoform X2 [Venturia canescens]|uniref:plectin isoform X2 n=1 Tax=Venturia canescens TaxID=32260 RepID=UPI001C9BEF66|nr:plectin-like isoform X2 [Venturia canescens]